MNDLPYYAGQKPSREIADTFEKTWSCERKISLSENRPPKLWTTVMKSIGYWNLTLVFFTAALAAACRVIQQLLLIYILTLMAAGTRDVNLWLFTGGFIMSLFVEMVVKNQYFFFAQLHLRATTTSGLITLVYQKVSRGGSTKFRKRGPKNSGESATSLHTNNTLTFTKRRYVCKKKKLKNPRKKGERAAASLAP